MSISARLLLIIIIYPYHSVRAPFGPFTGVRLLLRLAQGQLAHLVSSGYLMPSADSRCTLSAPCGLLTRFSVAAGSVGFVFLSIMKFGSSPVRSRSSDDAGNFVSRDSLFRQFHTTAPEIQRASRGKHTSFGT